MSGITPRLLQYLTRANPEVNSSWSLRDNKASTKSKARSNDKAHDQMFLRDVFKWESLGWKEDLKPILGDVLDLPMRDMPTFEALLEHPSHLREIHDENSLDALLIRWNYPVVSAALSMAQHHERFPSTAYGRDHSGQVSMARGGQAWVPLADRRERVSSSTKQDKCLFPDWAGILLDDDGNAQLGEGNQDNARHYLNILPGDTKLSTKFKSEWGWNDKRFDGPIIQVFTYCRRANVRYGYIVTQEELVVLRLFWGDENEPNRFTEGEDQKLYLEYKSIPWVPKGGDELTVNLTLWCLHMLAAKRKPIRGRNSLGSEYQPSESSLESNISESDKSSKAASSESTPTETAFHSFKRLRSEDTRSEESVPLGKTKRIRS